VSFDSPAAENWDVYVVDSGGGTPRRLTHSDSMDSKATWSADGKWIYFESNRTGDLQLWRISVDGGEASQVTQNGGTYAFESTDPQNILFLKDLSGAAGIWKMKIDGGSEFKAVDRSFDASHQGIFLSSSGIYFLSHQWGKATNVYSINFLDSSSGEIKEIYKKEGPLYLHSITVAPDESWILFTEDRYFAFDIDIMLMENFR